MKQWIATVVAGVMLGFAACAQAVSPDANPDALVEGTIQEAITLVKHEKDPKKIQAMVDDKILPLFDFTLITKRAIGVAWKTASAEQKQQLVEEFRSLLVRVFISKAFNNLSNRTVKVEHGDYTSGDDQTTVHTVVNTPGEAPLSVDYDFKKTAGGWKVVDLGVAGPRVALEIYRNQFQGQIQQGGVDSVIKFLADKNHEAAGVKKADLK